MLPRAKPEVRDAGADVACAAARHGPRCCSRPSIGARSSPTRSRPRQLRQIALFKEPRVEELLTKHWGKVAEETPAEKRARIHGISVSMNWRTGDPVRGKPLFAKHCGNCHTLFGEGKQGRA